VKFNKKKLFVVMLLIMAMSLLASCGDKSSDESSESDDSNVSDAVESSTPFDYSEAFDENGMWKDIVALDFVDLADYKNIEIPADIHTVADEDVDTQVDSVLAYFSSTKQITDRAVMDGDTLNIDYVGSVDGVEFEGGSTQGAGSEVTIGVTNFIDDFLEQLIGHEPGETFDIEVTFPEEYGKEELNGKDAVFNITINYIVETVESELTDDFVTDNLSAEYGWTSVVEMKDGIRSQIEKTAIAAYVQDKIVNESTIKSIPESITAYFNKSMLNYYSESAASYGVELEEFLLNYVGVSSVDELMEMEHEATVDTSKYTLIIQAIAEDSELSIKDEDISKYFLENMGSDDYSSYEERFGLPYIKFIVLDMKVLDYVMENAVKM
jgi:FKBP-type peptidyl-prolyl cis-trans isomerase (trigger factor)